jgi:hypothetical protein
MFIIFLIEEVNLLMKHDDSAIVTSAIKMLSSFSIFTIFVLLRNVKNAQTEPYGFFENADDG